MLCKQCPAFASLANVEMTGASGCQLVVDLLDYPIMKYPTPLVSVILTASSLLSVQF